MAEHNEYIVARDRTVDEKGDTWERWHVIDQMNAANIEEALEFLKCKVQNGEISCPEGSRFVIAPCSDRSDRRSITVFGEVLKGGKGTI